MITLIKLLTLEEINNLTKSGIDLSISHKPYIELTVYDFIQIASCDIILCTDSVHLFEILKDRFYEHGKNNVGK